MEILNFIIWSPDPVIFTIPLEFIGLPGRPIVWYGLLFALGFIISQQIMYKLFEADGKPKKDVDHLTTYMVVATIVGARLGHCLFYNPGFYLSNPIEILKIWEGGLASHGATIGIPLAVYFFVKKFKGYTWLWMLDRLVIVVALTGAMIRTGNLMNSEMEGTETLSSYGLIYARGTEEVLTYDDDKIESVTFKKGGEKQSDLPGRFPITAVVTYKKGSNFGSEGDRAFVEGRLRSSLLRYTEVVQHVDFDANAPLSYNISQQNGQSVLEIYGIGIARHPGQVYEAIACLFIMALLYWLWWKKREQLPEGFFFALFNIILWSQRFIVEFFKMDQEDFEADLTLNMGQLLSIPMFLFGVGVMIYIYRKKSKAEA